RPPPNEAGRSPATERKAAPSNQSVSTARLPGSDMAMAASSRMWASRAAAYLRISTFPRAFSTGTCPSLLPVTPAVSCALARGISALCCW
ncbi:unnamed protein product, partial [Urochloa humidicola]